MTSTTLTEGELERPRAVTVISWVWLIAGILFLLRSLLDLVIWRMLQPAAPSLFAAVEQQSPQMSFLRPLFKHLATVKIIEAVASAGVICIASQFLRLRAWARVAVQAVCWLTLCYIVSFAILWVGIWTHMTAEPAGGPMSSSYSHRMIGLVGGLAVCLLFAAGLVTMIALLRGSRVRAAFHPPRSSVSSR